MGKNDKKKSYSKLNLRKSYTNILLHMQGTCTHLMGIYGVINHGPTKATKIQRKDRERVY